LKICVNVWKLTDVDTLSTCSDCLDLFLNVLSASWLLPDFTIWFWWLSLWMSVRFVACVTRYSRGAKNRYNLKYNTCFITIFLWCIIAKNYPNWPRIDKIIGKIKRVQFFETQCIFFIRSLLQVVHSIIDVRLCLRHWYIVHSMKGVTS